jgi:prephenate dehydratase
VEELIRIGYLGPQGSFSEEAINMYLNKCQGVSGVELTMYPSIPLLLQACQVNDLDFAFLPVENSTEGQVAVTADMLKEMVDLFVVDEYIHNITQCLMAPRIIALEEITRVYSHEQALGQCRNYLNTHIANAEQLICSSTSEAARKVSNAKEKWAAIGPLRASEVYNLHCLAEGIEDTTTNVTRFIMVGHHIAEMTGEDKTSILFSTPNTPGALCQVLNEFASRKINLTRIESRPSKQQLGEYVFYIDFDGYVFAPAIQDVLWVLRESGVWVKLLGSYPKAETNPGIGTTGKSHFLY